jgi:hypothetical protein
VYTGNISVEEFAQVMYQSPGKPPSKAEVEQIIREVNLDGDRTINFNGRTLLALALFPFTPYPPPPSLSVYASISSIQINYMPKRTSVTPEVGAKVIVLQNSSP